MARAALAGPHGARDAADQLSTDLRVRYAADSAVLVDSGTSALQLAIRVATGGGGPARPVVALPAFTCFEVATAAVGADVDVVLYDLLPDSLAPDPESLERALRTGARVVVISPLFGIPAAWDEVTAQLARYGATMIEDAAQGHGASWRGRPLGSFGMLSVLSFGRGKGWTGSGGGALLMRGSPATARITRTLLSTFSEPASRALARALTALAQWSLGRPALYGIPAAVPSLGLGRTRYREPTPPRAIDAFSARLLLATAGAANREAAVRRDTARQLCLRLAATNAVRPTAVPAGGEAGFLRLPVRLVADRAVLSALPLGRRLGISRTYPVPLHTLPAIRERLRGSGAYPGAVALAKELLTLPTHSLVTRAELDDIVMLLHGMNDAGRGA